MMFFRAITSMACCLGLAVLTGLPAPAFAKEPVSGKFDGTYAGASHVVGWMSAKSCKPIGSQKLVIRNGQMKSAGKGSVISGIVVSSGFLTGGYWVKGVKGKGVVQGLIDKGHLIAAVGSHNKSCYWMMNLARQ